MLYYPQLSTGASAQLPLRRRLSRRTVINEDTSGGTIRMSDAGAKVTSWQLQYKGLSNAELALIQQLFEASEGRLGTFTFLDPSDNLLEWSGDWTKPAWTVSPTIQVEGGMADPMGGSAAMQLTNTGQASQRVVQSIAAASWFQYCFSIYVRSDAAGGAKIVASGSSEDSTSAVVTSVIWTRVTKVAGLTAKNDGISFGIDLAAGQRIYVFGAQAEAQGSAGLYKPTTDRAGVYGKTRFESDALMVSIEGVNNNSCTVQLVSGE